MSPDLALCVSTIPLTFPRFPAKHGPNTDPIRPSTRDLDSLPLEVAEVGSVSMIGERPLTDRRLHVVRERIELQHAHWELRPWQWFLRCI
jgi:hypothetical protein